MLIGGVWIRKNRRGVMPYVAGVFLHEQEKKTGNAGMEYDCTEKAASNST
jgi:hypothetical protein